MFSCGLRAHSNGKAKESTLFDVTLGETETCKNRGCASFCPFHTKSTMLYIKRQETRTKTTRKTIIKAKKKYIKKKEKLSNSIEPDSISIKVAAEHPCDQHPQATSPS